MKTVELVPDPAPFDQHSGWSGANYDISRGSVEHECPGEQKPDQTSKKHTSFSPYMLAYTGISDCAESTKRAQRARPPISTPCPRRVRTSERNEHNEVRLSLQDGDEVQVAAAALQPQRFRPWS